MQNENLEFPVVYNLRVIYKGSSSDGIAKVERLLKDLTVSYENGVERPGGKNGLCRLGFNVTLLNKSQMDAMYSNLNSIPEVKWAT